MKSQYIKEIFENNHQIITKSKPQIDGLFAGNLGVANYYALLHKISGAEESDHKDNAIQILEKVLNDFYSSKSTLSQATYTGGASGLGYTICFLNKVLDLELDLDDDLSDLDEYLYNSAVDLIEKNNLDCLHGAGGILFYFSERKNGDYINKLVKIIISKAKIHEDGVWFPNHFMGLSQEGIANLSISHGMAGLLLILLKTVTYLNEDNFIILQKVLRGSITFINSYYLPIDAAKERDSFYPSSVDVTNSKYSHKCRLAWCYGDLGIIILFYQAGKFLQDKELIRRANEMGIQTLTRKSIQQTGIDEPFYCHGSAGLSSFYYKLYLESKDERYLEGMDFWIKETANFFSVDQKSFVNTPFELLDGLIGVNIAISEYLNRDKSISLSNIFFL